MRHDDENWAGCDCEACDRQGCLVGLFMLFGALAVPAYVAVALIVQLFE